MTTEFDGLPLFTTPPPPPAPVDILADGHRREALEWMRQHPEALAIFTELALMAADRGRKFGMKALAERVRWEFAITSGEEAFKVNNNFISHIARELIRRHPRLAEFIELRRTKEDS